MLRILGGVYLVFQLLQVDLVWS